MNFLIGILLIIGGLVVIFYIRPQKMNSITESKYMQTKAISELQESINNMSSSGYGEYREYVELKGTVTSENSTKTPFSERKVAYCESKLYEVTEREERYRDSNGNMQNRIRKDENIISNEKSSQVLYMKDSSSNESVVLDINASGCKFDIPKTFDRFEPKNNLRNYGYFDRYSWNRMNAQSIGYKMVESTIENNQNLYVIGEAFKVGDQIHIGKPQDAKKPFIVTTKTEEDLINSSNKQALAMLIGGIVVIVLGFIMLFK